jgi:hypothetical protein
MSTPENPSSTQPVGSALPTGVAVETPVVSSFEDTLQRLWAQYGKAIIIGCVAVLLAILAKGGLDYLAAQKEVEVRQAYAAATTPEKLKAFAGAHAGHVLAGVAHLRMADEAYAAGQGSEAVTHYEASLKALAAGPLEGRNQLGLAMAQVLAGRTAEGEAALKQLADRTSAPAGLRAQAAYQLASLAQTAGRADDVNKFADLVVQIDATSPWAQRALTLRSQSPAPAGAAVAAAPAVPATEGESTIKLNLPAGK